MESTVLQEFSYVRGSVYIYLFFYSVSLLLIKLLFVCCKIVSSFEKVLCLKLAKGSD